MDLPAAIAAAGSGGFRSCGIRSPHRPGQHTPSRTTVQGIATWICGTNTKGGVEPVAASVARARQPLRSPRSTPFRHQFPPDLPPFPTYPPHITLPVHPWFPRSSILRRWTMAVHSG